jgi:phosphoglycerol transferase
MNMLVHDLKAHISQFRPSAYLKISVLTFVIFVYQFQINLKNYEIPIIWQGDQLAVAMWIKRAAENFNYLSTFNQGYPFGSQIYDYPFTEHLQVFFYALIYKITNSMGLTFNVIYLITYILIANSTLFLMLQLKIEEKISIILSLASSFTFYHLWRLPHLYLSNYFIVSLLLWSYYQLFSNSKLSKQKVGFIYFIFALTSTINIYYALYNLIVLGAILAIKFKLRKWNLIFYSLVVSVFTFVLTLFPYIFNIILNGKNSIVSVRQPIESEMFSFKFMTLFLPSAAHRFEILNRLNDKYLNISYVNLGEVSSVSIGILASIGIIIVILFGFISVLNVSGDDFYRHSFKLLAIFVFIGSIGFLPSFINLFTGTYIRGWNRISIFILILGLLTLGKFITDNIKKKGLYNFTSILLVLVFFLDQTISRQQYIDGTVATLSSNIRTSSFDRDRKLGKNISGLLEKYKIREIAVWQEPRNVFPEAPQVNEMDSYYLARPYLFSNKNIFYSWPTTQGRNYDKVMENLHNYSLDKKLIFLRQLDFSFILIYKGAFKDYIVPYQNELDNLILNREIDVELETSDWLLLKISDPADLQRESLSINDMSTLTKMYYDSSGNRNNSNSLQEGINFFEDSIPNWISSVDGLYSRESFGSWIKGERLTIKLNFSGRCDVKLTANVFEPNLRYKKDFFESAVLSKSATSFKLSEDIKEYTIFKNILIAKNDTLTILNSKTISPYDVIGSSDRRYLGIGVKNLSFNCISPS